jgi:hypothetical protein
MEMRTMLEIALRELGVEVAGRRDNPLRWSASDLATDMAPIILREMAVPEIRGAGS